MSNTFSARLDAAGLRGGGGYLGVTPMPTTPRKLLVHGKINVELLIDLDPNQVRLIEERRDGAFGLNLFIEAFGEKDDGSRSNDPTAPPRS